MRLLSSGTRHRRLLTWTLLALTLAVISATGALAVTASTAAQSAAPAAAATGPVIHPVVSCTSLASVDLTRLDTRIASAASVTKNNRAFCDVKGYITPQTKFEILLPQTTWRGSYLQQGCGGFCGHADVSLQDPSRTSAHQAPLPRCPTPN